MADILPSSALVFAAALWYSPVGQAGASACLTVMALYGTAPEAMKPAALALNVPGASIGTVRFYRAGYLRREVRTRPARFRAGRNRANWGEYRTRLIPAAECLTY
jgi:hypothetical protein